MGRTDEAQVPRGHRTARIGPSGLMTGPTVKNPHSEQGSWYSCAICSGVRCKAAASRIERPGCQPLQKLRQAVSAPYMHHQIGVGEKLFQSSYIDI